MENGSLLVLSGNRSGLAQGLACGKTQYMKKSHLYPISVPVSSLSCQTPAGLRILQAHLHSPTQSKPVTVVWVCAGNKEDLSDRTFLSPACSSPGLRLQQPKPGSDMALSSHQSPGDAARHVCHSVSPVLLPGMSAASRRGLLCVRPRVCWRRWHRAPGKGKVPG